MGGQRWEVVGGADKGGIVVRAGKELTSEQLPDKLSTGAHVEQVDRVGDRLQYWLLEGTGPKEGWVSVRLKDKALLEERAAPDERPTLAAAPGAPAGQQSYVPPAGRNFGKDGKMKILFLYGGGVNSKCAKLQLGNIFRDSTMFKKLSFDVFEAPTATGLSWHPEVMQQQLKMFGDTIYLYFDRIPYANCQWESWVGIEKTFDALRAYLKENGPYDGVCGFDMGGEVLVQAARMAQEEGDAGFQRMFRFMILFTTGSAKHLSALGKEGKRPKAPLRVPAIISWSNTDENHPYTWYEETPLFFAPEFREVITHKSGHMPPRLAKSTEELERLNAFLEAFYNDTPFRPSDHPDNAWNRALQLPVERIVARAAPSGARRRLLVVHDPMGAHDYEARLRALTEALAAGHVAPAREAVLFKTIGYPDTVGSAAMDLEVSRLSAEDFREAAGDGVAVEGVEYSEGERSYDWHCAPEETPRPMKREDIILEHQEPIAARWAHETLQKIAVEADDGIALVGIGTGAFLALHLAKLLISERSLEPTGLFVVDPPTRLPFASTQTPGALGGCPVRFLTHSTSLVGPPWRWEVSTLGPFSMSTFKDPAEAVRLVLEECKV